MIATTLVGSRPMVASLSGRGMVEFFEGPAVTNSLGRNSRVPYSAQNFLPHAGPECIFHKDDFHYPNG
jgi:hypothetical protein